MKEGSIGFEFRRPQCSICARDIRSCEHVPGREYTDESGVAATAHYEYREIVRILETSLVYRGANPDTRLGNEPVFSKLSPGGPSGVVFGIVLDRQSNSDGSSRYIIARRDPHDSTICDELVAVSRSAFRVGDLVFNRHGIWRNCNALAHPARRTDRPIHCLAYLCGPGRTRS
ncbi:MAG: hypothetical protein HZB43_12240 [candidate division Zixibacteria bacterium]|nr:hypothetical protein [candidate division Zixibacteria bacterium]